MSKNVQSWYPAYIALGSNQKNPVRQLRLAIENIAGLDKLKLVTESGFYTTEPYGPVSQDEFVNAVIGVLTTLEPEELMLALLGIEKDMGRVREERWGPRIIDLDLLVYSDKTSDTELLKLPHPEIAKRNFVLLPLSDIAPGLQIAGVGCVSRLLAECEGGTITRIEPNTK